MDSQPKEINMKLKYTGNGSWFPGIPATDLTAEQVEKHGGLEKLLASGLYKLAEAKEQEPKGEGD